MALSNGLVSYWSLDGDGTDELGTNNMTETSMTYDSSIKIQGSSGIFNGSTSKLQKTSSSLPTGSSARTFSIWFRKDDNGDDALFMYGTASTGQMWYMGCSGGSINTLKFYGIARDYLASATINTNTWYHGVWVYDGSDMNIYLDGTKLGSGATIALNTATGTTATIGDDTWVAPPHDGYIDEVACWNRALSASEITELYNSGAGLSYADIVGGAVAPQFLGFAGL